MATGPELTVPEGAPATLADVLRRASEEAAARRVIRVGRDGGEVVLRYDELRSRAERILGGLRARGARPGDEVILQLGAVDEFLPAFWACVLGGFTAVPCEPAGAHDGAGTAARRLRDVWSTLDRPLVVAATGAEGPVRAALGVDAHIAPVAELAAHAPDPAWHPSPPEAIAALLLSSGTTGRPRLIQRSHHNLLCVCQRNPGLAGCAEITFLNWLPLDHNAGLTSSMSILAAGADQVQLGTRDVLEAPGHWLEGLHRYRVTHTGGTNYSLGLINAHLAAGGGRAGWDFSRVQSFVVSAEPVVARTVRAFLEQMAPYGLRPEALRPSYGSTEAGGISRLTDLRLDEGGDAFVEAGTLFPGISLRVTDAAGRVVEEGREGRIQVRGDTVTPGYARDPGHTRESFTGDGWFITGDLGYLRAGRLMLTGREKDVLILNGVNVASQEIEAEIEAVDGVERGCTAVCAVRRGDTDAAAVFLHTPFAEAGERDALRREVRRVVAARFGATVAHLLLVGRDEIPRTATGKIRRPVLRRRLEAGDFAAAVAEDAGAGGGGWAAPRTEVERELCAAWAEILGVERVGIDDDFLGLGGHSLLATRMVSRIRGALGVELPLRALFEAPTVARLAERVEALRGAAPASAAPPVLPVERTGAPLASFAQERLWFLDRLQPGSPLFNLPVSLRLAGALDLAALERAIGEIVRRHEPLRTTFAEPEGVPVQVIAPFRGFALAVEDLSALGAEEREAVVRRRAGDDAARPFDLSAGPLFRAGLLRLGGEEHVLLLCMHHIVSDGWSMRVFFRELAALYEAYRDGRESPLPALAVQYADHAVWQRRHLRGETLERQVAWWRERLAGAPELLELPTGHPRPAVQRHRGAHEPIRIGAALRERLEALGRSEGATLFMVVLGAFQVLLAKYAGSADVVVGSTVAGRTRGETEGLIGLFMNVLVLRTDLSGDPGFREVLRRVREVTLAASEHQDVPFERLVTALRPERSLGHSPLVQVLFELHNDEGMGARLPGLRVEGAEPDAVMAKFDLSVTMSAGPDGLTGGLTYSTDLFEPATARRMVAHLERVLEQVAGDADRRLSGLELIGPDERRRVLEEWNRTEAPYPAGRCIHQLFEAQAERTPDAPAVVFAGRTLTYRELDERANRLARHLIRLGVGPEVRVGLCLERSPELMVAILGVMKAGGAYVPVDPAHPAERIGYVLEDSAVAAVLTQERLRDALPVLGGVRVISVDTAWGEIAAESADAPATGVTSENLAYVIYTSGSTGRPKGVAMHHRGVANYIDWGVRAYGADAGSGAPVFSSMAVDLTITNLLPLFAGHPVHLLPEENAVEALADALRGAPGYGLIKITPVHLSLLTPLLTPEEARGAAKTLVIGADFLSAEPTVWWQEHAPDVRLMNEYGPTETVVGCSAYVLPRGRHTAGPVPVGHPIQNLRFYVLDAHLHPVPVGLPGELFIGGAGVARGYLGRPGLSAEKFVPDPFAAAGARMYRTGDRARWLEGGDLMILGRTDSQVKIRGYRVEPGEIEAALR
ncbi:non-ribosomal peptide synthetase, partial [Longimicrobium sp.]|uniref:non-ribosomal peptide synthetase n=1 Tax=Longimicrobium sp. TaxID=2029185 RepID=UPI002C116622